MKTLYNRDHHAVPTITYAYLTTVLYPVTRSSAFEPLNLKTTD